MKRGLRCDFVHFSGRPFTGAESAYKAYAQTARLDRFQGGSRLFIVPFGRAQRQNRSGGSGRLQVLAQRRLMVRVASALGCGRARRPSSRAIRSARSRREPPQPGGRRGRRSAPAAQAARRLGQGGDRSRGRGARHPRGGDPPAEDCCTLFASPLAETRAEPEKLARLEASEARCGRGRAGRGGRARRRPRLERPRAAARARRIAAASGGFAAEFTFLLRRQYAVLTRSDDHAGG